MRLRQLDEVRSITDDPPAMLAHEACRSPSSTLLKRAGVPLLENKTMTGKWQVVTRGVGATLVLAVLAAAGCSKPKPTGPSYAEALAIYNQEVLALDRLRAQRDKLKEALAGPEVTNLDVAKQVLGSIGSTVEVQKELSGVLEDLGAPGIGPKEGEGDEERPDVVGVISQQLEEVQKREEKKAEEWKTKKKEIAGQIAELDKAIAEQEQRVARAEADKNAAEAARR